MSQALRRHGPAALFLLILALALRAPQFGNPTIHIDEQFYLLVGDRMWHGALPFVDFWDRKPVGLFLIYAAIRVLDGDGVLAYQLVATVFAAATAFVIARLARRIAPPRAGVAAGAIYLIFLMVNGGDGGQAPVFYNLLVAGAALCAMRVIDRPRFDRAAFTLGCWPMLLLGIAIQIKYTVLFEGGFFGLAMLIAARRSGVVLVRLAISAFIWVAIALAPTGLVLACYTALGHADGFIFTNFHSIFLRAPFDHGDLARRIGKLALRLAPMTLVAFAALWIDRKTAGRATWFFSSWLIIALLSLIGFGTYHEHYALPVLVPLAVVGAPIYGWQWRRIPIAALIIGGIGVVAALSIVGNARERRGTGPETRQFVDRIALRPGEKLFVFSGDPILYHLTHSPLPTAYNFPTLLSERSDAASLGIDPLVELRHVMSHRPRYVVTHDRYPYAQADPRAWEYMQTVLGSDYRLVFSKKLKDRHRLLYERITPRY